MEEFVVYVLFSETSCVMYVGCSSGSIQRFYWHNDKSKKGLLFDTGPWKMIHIEFFTSKKDALSREKALKSCQGRAWIENTVIPQMISRRIHIRLR